MLLTTKNPEILRSNSTKDTTESRRQVDLLQSLSKLETDLKGSYGESYVLGPNSQMLSSRRISLNLDNQQLKDQTRNVADILLSVGKAMMASNSPYDVPGVRFRWSL